MDFYNATGNARDLDPYFKPITSNYFPFAYLLLFFVSLLGSLEDARQIYFVALTSFFAFWCYRGLKVQSRPVSILNVVSIGLVSFPFLILLDRGNAEGLLFINLGLFFIYYKKGEPKLYIPLLASAIAMKLYPAVFLVYLLGDRKFKEILQTLGIAAALTVGSAMLMVGGVARTLEGLQRGLVYYRDEYVLLGAGRSFGHSLFGMLRVTREAIFGSDWAPGVLEAFVSGWGYLTVLAFLGLTYLTLISRGKEWKKTAVFVLSFCLFPHVSPDYRMILLFLPFIQFLSDPEAEAGDLQYAVLIGLILVPKPFHYFGTSDTGIATIVNPLLLATLLILLCRDLWMSRSKTGWKI